MRRTSRLVPLINLVTLPNASQRRHPDRVFDQLVDRAQRRVRADPALRRVCGDAGVDAALSTADEADWRYLVASYADAAGLTRFGWTMVVADLEARLANQLRVRALHRALPGIGHERLQRPIVVVGLPRTATTVTHKVIAQSHGHRAPRLWELMHTTTGLFPDEQRAKTREIDQMMRMFARLAPSMRVIHPQYAEAPDEDHLVLPHGIHHPSRVLMPQYQRWCLERDYTRDYDYLKGVYQVLQHSQAEPTRWVIKAPCHLLNLNQLVRIFPDATFVWLHRDPATLLGSMCSLMETAQAAHVRRPDLHGIGDLCIDQLAAWVDRARAARLNIQRGQIVDVSYHDVVADPETKMPRLYERIGAAWTDADTQRLRPTMARPTSYRHDYAPGRYGINDDRIEAAFGDYIRAEQQLHL